MGRPRKEEAEKAVHIRLPQRLLDMIDAKNRRDTFENPAILAQRFPSWIDEGVSSRQIATLRREFISGLIEKALSDEAQFPTRIRIVAPVAGSPAEVQEATDWMRDHEAFLNREPPAAIRNGIKANRIKNDPDDREELRARLLRDTPEASGQ